MFCLLRRTTLLSAWAYGCQVKVSNDEPRPTMGMQPMWAYLQILIHPLSSLHTAEGPQIRRIGKALEEKGGTKPKLGRSLGDFTIKQQYPPAYLINSTVETFKNNKQPKSKGVSTCRRLFGWPINPSAPAQCKPSDSLMDAHASAAAISDY